MLYSRASADPDGQAVVGAQEVRLVGRGRRGSGPATTSRTSPSTSAPDYRPGDDAEGMDAIGGADPFIMMADGRGWLYAPSGLLDGPLPTHYEPIESPVRNLLYPERPREPRGAALDAPRTTPRREPGDPRYPYVATTFRLTEHHTAGGMSRWLPWLDELQPEMFAEIDPVLAAQRGIEDGGLDDDLVAARRDRRARPRDRPHEAAEDRPGDRPPGRAAVALGLRRAGPRRRGQRPDPALRRPEHVDPRVQGVRVRRARRPRAAAARSKLAGVRRRAAASRPTATIPPRSTSHE